MDALFRDTRKNGPEKLAPGHESLVFAVYYAAIVALEEGEESTLSILYLETYIEPL